MNIYKYPLNWSLEPQHIRIPKYAQILDCQIQEGKLVIWALFNESENDSTRTFRIIATGQQFTKPKAERYVHIATAQNNEDSLVWHIFECASVLD